MGGIGCTHGEADFAVEVGGQPERDGHGVVGIELEGRFRIPKGHHIIPGGGRNGERNDIVEALIEDPDRIGFFVGEERLIGRLFVIVVAGGGEEELRG